MARSPTRRLLDLAVDATVSAFCGYHSRRRLFLQHERTLIRDARMGNRIKIVGQLRGNGPPSSAPLSGVTCLCYQTVVQLSEGEAWGKKIWAEQWPNLFVDDESGSVLIRMLTAEMSLVEMRTGWVHDPPPFAARRESVGRFLDGYALDNHVLSERVSAKQSVRYKEVVLREGDRVAVIGRPLIELDPTARGVLRGPATRVAFADEPGESIVSNEPDVWF
jgi:hypothetical protein